MTKGGRKVSPLEKKAIGEAQDAVEHELMDEVQESNRKKSEDGEQAAE
jgi:hypothetical protein